jgi:hypothetical protein
MTKHSPDSIIFKLTPDSMMLFITLANEAPNYNGTPYIDLSNKSYRGNLTDLVKKGLIDVFPYENGVSYAVFTEEGKSLAATFGIQID